MEPSKTMRTRSLTRAMIGLVIVVAAAACSASDDSNDEIAAAPSVEIDSADYEPAFDEAADVSSDGDDLAQAERAAMALNPAGTIDSIDARVIRDGMVDIRIAPGSFGSSSKEIRVIAADLGGYVSSGESSVETYGEERYAVGWFTIRIPSDRFDDAIARIDGLGETVSSSMSSQDVTEEYVDLESRLTHWREQEAFYSRLMEEAATIEDLVAVQTRMQDVLLNIEQIEGRLRYLDSRTEFATVTVGLTEVPDGSVAPWEHANGGTIARALEQAGDVLLASVGFMIVATAAIIPIGILAVFIYLVARLALSLRRRRQHAQA